MKAQAQSLILEGKENAAETVRKELIAEQPGRRIYRTNKRDFLIQEFVPPPPTNGDRKNPNPALPILRNRISTYLFEYLKGFHVPTHYLKALEGPEMLVKSADPIPLIVRVFNLPEDDWQARFGVEAARLEFPVIEHHFPGSGGAPSWVNEYHLYAFNLVKPDEFRQVNRLASKVNAVLRGLCERRDLTLAKTSLTFGRYNDQVILTGELSNVTCSFLENPGPNRGGNGSYKPIDGSTEESLERLHGRLKLNG